MNKPFLALASTALAIGYVSPVIAQYAPPPPPQPFPGFINDFLRKQDPYYSVWDIGGSVRLRYELKENGLGLPPANDWRDTSGTTIDNDNSYFSDKVLAHIGTRRSGGMSMFKVAAAEPAATIVLGTPPTPVPEVLARNPTVPPTCIRPTSRLVITRSFPPRSRSAARN